jgi:hypothetical protein
MENSIGGAKVLVDEFRVINCYQKEYSQDSFSAN